MKKIIISLAAASALLFTGCFIDSDTAIVRINLGNLPVAKVEKKSLIDRFLMIFAKEAVAQVPADVTSINIRVTGPGINTIEKNYPMESSVIEMNVPAGNNIRIEIRAFQESVGGGDYNNVYTYGFGITTDLAAGETKNISAYMIGIPYALYANAGNGLDVGWSIEGSLNYQFTVEWSETIDGEYVELVSGETNYWWSDGGSGIVSGFIRVTAYSGEYTGLPSVPVEVIYVEPF